MHCNALRVQLLCRTCLQGTLICNSCYTLQLDFGWGEDCEEVSVEGHVGHVRIRCRIMRQYVRMPGLLALQCKCMALQAVS